MSPTHRHHQQHQQQCTGFTLFELVVSVTILALLMALIFSCISSVRFQAQRVECMSNMRQLYILFSMHAKDHRGRVLATSRVWYGQLSPDSIGISGPVAESGEGLSWPNLQPYVDTPVADSLTTTEVAQTRTIGVWMCPSRRAKDSAGGMGNLVNQGDGNTYLNTSYSYLAGSEKWSNVERASSGDDITQAFMDPQRILMSDLFVAYPGNEFYINHTRLGTSAGSPIPSTFSGMNRLCGDGRVAWKQRSEFDVPAIISEALSQPQVRNHSTVRWYY